MRTVTEEEIRGIASDVRKRLGDDVDPQRLKKIVTTIVERIQTGSGREDEADVRGNSFRYLNQTDGRMIVTVYGKNHAGIIAEITKVLAECECDVQDITQKILQEFFTMIMIVDISKAICPFGVIRDNLAKASEKLGIKILAQHEDVFRSMHRI